MATLTITIAGNGNAGALYRRLAHQIEQAVRDMPDNPSSGASSVLTIDNGTGTATVQITAGPYASALYPV
jgi:hypothetical protein